MTPVSDFASGHLYVDLQLGLGNRLSALLSLWVAAEAENIPVTFIWKPSPGGFADLFLPCPTLDIVAAKPTNSPPGEWPLLTHFNAELIAALRRGETRHIHARSLINYAALPDWEFFDRVAVCFARLTPHPAVEATTQRHATPNIGLHARFNDNLPSMLSTPRWCYRWLIRSIVETHPDARIWCCGDAPEFLHELRATYPNNLFLAASAEAAEPPTGKTVAEQQQALAEILTLSRCALVFGSENSSFCKVATYFTRIPFVRLCNHAITQRAAFIRISWQLSNLAFDPIKGPGSVIARIVDFLVRLRLYQDIPTRLSRHRFVAEHLTKLKSALQPKFRS